MINDLCTKLVRRILTLLFVMSFIFTIVPTASAEQEYNLIYGPQEIHLASGTVSLSLPSGYIFLDKEETEKMLREMNEPIDEGVEGYICTEDSTWGVYIDRYETGYIKDDDAESIAPDELLNIIINNTNEANEDRMNNGGSRLIIKDWYLEPSYSKNNHMLTYALIANDEGTGVDLVNYRNIIFGRSTILLCTLVNDYSSFSASKGQLSTITSSLKFTPGNDYLSYVKGDEISDITMTGLITGGTAATAVLASKTGLLSKLGGFLAGLLVVFKKAIILVIIAVFAGLKAIWNLITGKQNKEDING